MLTNLVVWRRSAVLGVMVTPTLACLAYGGHLLATGDPRSRVTVLLVGGVSSLAFAIAYGNLRLDADLRGAARCARSAGWCPTPMPSTSCSASAA